MAHKSANTNKLTNHTSKLTQKHNSTTTFRGQQNLANNKWKIGLNVECWCTFDWNKLAEQKLSIERGRRHNSRPLSTTGPHKMMGASGGQYHPQSKRPLVQRRCVPNNTAKGPPAVMGMGEE